MNCASILTLVFLLLLYNPSCKNCILLISCRFQKRDWTNDKKLNIEWMDLETCDHLNDLGMEISVE